MNKDAIIKLVNEQLWTKGEADVPQFKAGDTITVSYKIVEGNKERVQSFRGVVIQIKGSGKTKMFTIRKISGGVGVERIFRPGYVQAGPVVSKPPSALPKPSPVPPAPVPPEPPPFSVKTTINRAPKRYFYTPFAPNEKNFVYLHSLSGRISTSFIGHYADAGRTKAADAGADGRPRRTTRDYGQRPRMVSTVQRECRMRNKKNCCNNEQRRNHQAR